MSDIQDQLGDALASVGDTIQGALGWFEILFETVKFFKAQKKQNDTFRGDLSFQTEKDSAGDILSGNNDAACEAARTTLESAET